MLLFIVSFIHFLLHRILFNGKMSFEDVLYTRNISLQRLLSMLLESSSWHLLAVALIIIIKNPSKSYLENILWGENLFLTFPAAMYVFLWSLHWIVDSKFGQDHFYRRDQLNYFITFMKILVITKCIEKHFTINTEVKLPPLCF